MKLQYTYTLIILALLALDGLCLNIVTAEMRQDGPPSKSSIAQLKAEFMQLKWQLKREARRPRRHSVPSPPSPLRSGSRGYGRAFRPPPPPPHCPCSQLNNASQAPPPPSSNF
ncbi:hypothetical protein BVRB_4g095570 [Beta vulgaris subsp. vulgaris]|uniref:Uncharacterized protein n=1 Tax=Beta vulgaris subsp. vulgaris TaxID=3555 RepID=A0A0J8BB52_BETVV|nr:hypothetical protein BVRB_4g095570 [Beta vulgaris subsp. vulgaris]